MNDHINPEINNEEAVDITSSVEESEEVKDSMTDITAPAEDSDDSMTDITASEETATDTDAKPAKKKRLLQIPVIISVCIVVAALLSYFVFTAFFLREPEGVTWSTELEGTPYYFEFNNDGTFNAYVGSIEINSTYQKSKGEDGNTITVGTSIGEFYGNAPATYTISGSRILGNQTMECSYGGDDGSYEGFDFSLTQAKREKVQLDLPEDFTPDEDLLGTWIFQYYGYDIFRVTFGEDGSMSLEQVQDGLTYHGIYTISDSTVNFTYYVTDNQVTPIEYKVDGDSLSFMGYNFFREGTENPATADQLVVPQD